MKQKLRLLLALLLTLAAASNAKAQEIYGLNKVTTAAGLDLTGNTYYLIRFVNNNYVHCEGTTVSNQATPSFTDSDLFCIEQIETVDPLHPNWPYRLKNKEGKYLGYIDGLVCLSDNVKDEYTETQYITKTIPVRFLDGANGGILVERDGNALKYINLNNSELKFMGSTSNGEAAQMWFYGGFTDDSRVVTINHKFEGTTFATDYHVVTSGDSFAPEPRYESKYVSDASVLTARTITENTSIDIEYSFDGFVDGLTPVSEISGLDFSGSTYYLIRFVNNNYIRCDGTAVTNNANLRFEDSDLFCFEATSESFPYRLKNKEGKYIAITNTSSNPVVCLYGLQSNATSLNFSDGSNGGILAARDGTAWKYINCSGTQLKFMDASANGEAAQMLFYAICKVTVNHVFEGNTFATETALVAKGGTYTPTARTFNDRVVDSKCLAEQTINDNTTITVNYSRLPIQFTTLNPDGTIKEAHYYKLTMNGKYCYQHHAGTENNPINAEKDNLYCDRATSAGTVDEYFFFTGSQTGGICIHTMLSGPELVFDAVTCAVGSINEKRYMLMNYSDASGDHFSFRNKEIETSGIYCSGTKVAHIDPYYTPSNPSTHITFTEIDAATAAAAEATVAAAMPSTEKYYYIKNGLSAFETNQLVRKALYDNGGTTLGWETFSATDLAQIWMVVKRGSLYVLRNMSDFKYVGVMNSLSDNIAAGKLLLWWQGEGSAFFNIVDQNLNVFHAGGHDNGNGTSGNIVTWGGTGNSASSWEFVEVTDADALTTLADAWIARADAIVFGDKIGQKDETLRPGLLAARDALAADKTNVDKLNTLRDVVENIYNSPSNVKVTFTIDGSTVIKQSYGNITSMTELQNQVDAYQYYADASYYTVGSIVANVTTYDVAVTSQNLPFVVSADEEHAHWYALPLHHTLHYYLRYDGEAANNVLTDQQMVEVSMPDSKLWAITGNVVTGFRLKNRAAGWGQTLQSDLPDASDNTGANTIATMQDGDGSGYSLYPSNHHDGGFYLKWEHSGYGINRRNTALAYWTDKCDGGSTFWVEEPAVPAWKHYLSVVFPTDASKSQLREALKVTAIGSDPGFISTEAKRAQVSNDEWWAALFELGEPAATLAEQCAQIKAKIADLSVVNRPQLGGEYFLVSAYEGFFNSGEKLMGLYDDGTGALKWKAVERHTRAMLWRVVSVTDFGEVVMQNDSTGRYLCNDATSGQVVTLSNDQKPLNFRYFQGQTFNIRHDGITAGNYLHCNGHNNGTGTNGNVIAYNATAGASMWYVQTPEYYDAHLNRRTLSLRVAELNEYTCGTGLGQYKGHTEAERTALLSTYTPYATEVTNVDHSDEYSDGITALTNFLTPLQLNMPTERFFRIQGATDKWVSADEQKTVGGNKQLLMADSNESSGTIFWCRNDGTLLSYSTGLNVIDVFGLGAVGTAGTTNISFQDVKKTHSRGSYGQYSIKVYNNGSDGYLYDSGNDASRVSTDRSSSVDGNCVWRLHDVTAIPVRITSAKLATLCLPVAVTLPTGVRAYTAQELPTVANAEGQILLSLAEITSTGRIPAGTPVLLYKEDVAAAGETVLFNIAPDDATVVNTPYAGTGSNKFAGTYAAIANDNSGDDVPNSHYVLGVLSNGQRGFFPTRSAKVNPFRAYLPHIDHAAGIRGYVFTFGSIATAIEASDSDLEEGRIYDLGGRSVQKAGKGLYIVNGKKIFIK